MCSVLFTLNSCLHHESIFMPRTIWKIFTHFKIYIVPQVTKVHVIYFSIFYSDVSSLGLLENVTVPNFTKMFSSRTVLLYAYKWGYRCV
jgi:fumarate reductase subunit C